MTTKKTEVYFCNRPTLAGKLIALGYRPDFRANPWNPGMTTWAFEITPELCRVVADFHREIGKEAPPIIMENLEEVQNNA